MKYSVAKSDFKTKSRMIWYDRYAYFQNSPQLFNIKLAGCGLGADSRREEN